MSDLFNLPGLRVTSIESVEWLSKPFLQYVKDNYNAGTSTTESKDPVPEPDKRQTATQRRKDN